MKDNRLKSLNGNICRQSLLDELIRLKKEKAIAYCETQFRDGYPGYSTTQFFAPFSIEFVNGERWLLFSTNSIRSDRVSIQQWNSFHLRKINPAITKAYLVVPNEISNNDKEFDIALSYNKKIQCKELYSSIDGVLLQAELINMISDYGQSLNF